MSNVPELTAETIQDFIENSDKPVMVCFYSSEEDAQWQFDKVLEEIATVQDKVAIGKIDSWKHPEPAKYYNAKWFPTSIMFVDGEIQDYCVGEDYADQIMLRFSKFFQA